MPMKIIISAKNFEITPSIESYVDEKINGLSKLIRVHEERGVAEARVDVSKTTQHHRKGDVFHADVNLVLPGSVLRAQSEGLDIFSAVDEVKDELARQIKAYKGKQSAKFRRGAQKVKQGELE